MTKKPLPSNPSSGKDSKLVSRLKGECWSVEQKEAIRAELALLILSSVVFREEVDGDLVKSLINKTMLAMEAITKGEEQ